MTKLAEYLRHVTDVLWLNILWLGVAVTVVGAPAATVAMVATAKDLQDGLGSSVSGTFRTHLVRTARATIRIGCLWLGVGGVLTLDLMFVTEIQSWRQVLAVGLLAIVLLFLATTVWLPCVVANTPASRPFTLVRLSGMIAVACPGATVQAALAGALAVGSVLIAPVAILAAPALAAHATALAWRLRVVPILPTDDRNG
ncbi:hypothetical protein ABZ863_27745 [Saccharomonospora sp. NPDC046836]|uniref:DUF624 domain-containing protein n=1 Tax=Saccharomonospora sp. NPDC046836 TaxID=3156921 RepID=UPI0033C2ADD6